MYILGITGNIGSGKTTATTFLAELGAIVSHSDDLAKELLNTDAEVRHKVSQRFGDDIYDKQGVLQRNLLAQRAFSKVENQLALNAIVHPAVRKASLSRIEIARSQGVKLFIIDAPLLLEAGVDDLTDSVLVIAASGTNRQTRVARRSGIEHAEFERRDSLQMPISEKIARADHVIWNDGDLEDFKEAVLDFYRSLNL